MGCHTWFSVPHITDKSEIIRLAQINLDKMELQPGYKKMYQWAIDNEIEEPICELAQNETGCMEYSNWILYKDIRDYSIEKYNKENGTNLDKYDVRNLSEFKLESYSDEPRIGGYPEEKVIRSYDELMEFMKTGFTDKDGKHFDFYFNEGATEEHKERVMNGIKQFFTNHPKGIITFG